MSELLTRSKPGEQRAYWSRRERDVVYDCGGAGACRPTSRLLAYAFEQVDMGDGKSLRAELEARGYDLTTLRFSIKLKAVAP